MAGYKKISRKKLLKEPDEILTFTSRMMQFVLEHRLRFMGILGLIIGVTIIASSVRYFSDQAENRAFTLLGQEKEQYQELVTKDGEEKAYQAAGEKFQNIFKEYSGKTGGEMARLAYADIAFKAKDFDTAMKLYQEVLEKFGNSPSLKNLILNRLAYTCEEKKDYPAALKYFGMIASGSDNLLKSGALFNLGRLYEQTGDVAKSLENFKKLSADYPDSIYADMVKEKIAANG